VLVDDHILVDLNHTVRFSRNLTFNNEIWISLIEKAFAKYMKYNIFILIVYNLVYDQDLLVILI